MEYINKVNEDMVKDFFYNDFDKTGRCKITKVKHDLNMWEITYKSIIYGEMYYETIVLTDFNLCFKDNSTNEVDQKCWQKFMYKKFGKSYLKDMKRHFKTIYDNALLKEAKELQNKYEKKKKHLDEIIAEIETVLSNELTK